MKKIGLAGLALSMSILAAPARAGDEGDAKGKDEASDKKDDKKEAAGNEKEDGDDKGADGDGKALGKDVEGENQKHAQRIAKLDRLDAIAKEKNRPELTDKVKMLRDKENARHERVLARLAKKDGADDKGGKPEDAGKGGKPEDAGKGGKPEDKGGKGKDAKDAMKDKAAEKKAELEAKKAAKEAAKEAKKGGKKDK